MAEVKKWVCMALFVFMIVGLLPSNLFTTTDDDSNEVQHYSLMWELKNMVLGLVEDGNWDSITSSGTVAVTDEKPSSRVVLSPNLTTCHRSLSDADVPVYCCPPKRESEEPFIDFKFPDASQQPIRVRRPAHLVDKEFIAKYNKALTIMKSLPYEDPRNFMRQANMHCIYCTGAYNQKHSNAILKIHRSWLFFPWHRMMIYFHERVIGSLIGDDTFALPFWNWDSPEGMVFPNMHLNGSFYDPDRDSSHFPSKVTDNNYNRVESGLGPEDQIAANLAFMYHQMVSGAKKMELFMGCPYKAGEDGFCNAPGTIENAPHNTLHSWVGSNLNPERENMGAFYSAARDPVFYAHHSNIDRLWEVWKGLRVGGDKAPLIDDSDWLDTYFFFHNEKSQLVRIKIRDVLDITNLRYTYQEVENPWLNARPKPSVPPQIARSMLNMRNNNNQNGLLLPSNNFTFYFGPEGRTLDTIIRVKVHRPKSDRTRKEKEEEEEVLLVYGIDVKKDIYAKFDVFINAVDETTIGPESREFAGTFVNVQQGVRRVMNEGDDVIVRRKSNIKLGISELLEDLEADGDESIWVSLVPRGGSGLNITIDGVRVEYLQ